MVPRSFDFRDELPRTLRDEFRKDGEAARLIVGYVNRRRAHAGDIRHALWIRT